MVTDILKCQQGGNTMKRIISLLLAVLLLAAMFCGCSGSGKTDAPSSTPDTSSAPDTSEPEDTEPEVVVPTEHFTDLETFAGADALLGQNFEKVAFWKQNIKGTKADIEKGSDPFNSWRTLTMTFEGTAPKLLGLDVPVDSIVATAFGSPVEAINAIEITFAGLTDEDKAFLMQEADKLDSASVRATSDKYTVIFKQ